MAIKDLTAAIVVFVFALAAYLTAADFGGGAGLFPRGVSVIMMICSVVLFGRGLFRPDNLDVEPMTPNQIWRVGISVVLSILYVALIVPLGFVTASVLFIPACAYVLGLRNHLAIWLGTFIFVGTIYFFFVNVFYTPLPREAIGALFR